MFLIKEIKKILYKLKLLIGIDLTVIIQGPISPRRALLLSFLYKLSSPFISIIISQYLPKDCHHILTNIFSKVIKNEINNDLHGIKKNSERTDNSINNNINLQILTTKNALKKTTSKYCLKTRSDCFFCSFAILFLPFYLFKENRILVINFSMPPFKIFLKSPCVSDWFFFGKTKEIYNGFSRYMPTNYLNCSNHINSKVEKYYKSENYSDFMQAEEFITWALIYPEIKPTLKNLLLFRDEFKNLDLIRKKFVVSFGPSILLINLGTKANFWNADHKCRSKLSELNSISLFTYGSLFEDILRKLFRIYKKIKLNKI